MKAGVVYATGKPVTVDDVEIGEPHGGEVKVRMMASGICHSDLSVSTGVLGSPLPVVLGEEGAGTVEAVGDDVTTVRKGDRVFFTWWVPCHRCPMCLRGRFHLCRSATKDTLNGTLRDGKRHIFKEEKELNHLAYASTMAEYSITDEQALLKVPDDADMEAMAVIGCGVLTGIGAVFNTARVQPGSDVCVVGIGGVGMNIIQGARIAGANRIIAVDVHQWKLDKAFELGATHLIDAAKEDVRSKVMKLTEDIGVDYSFEAIGIEKTSLQAMSLVAPGGMFVQVGAGRFTLSLDALDDLIATEKTVKGCLYGSVNPRFDAGRCLNLYRSGKLKLKELITKRYSIEQVNEAFADLNAGKLGRGLIRY